MVNTIRALEQIQKIDLEIKAIEEDEKRYLGLIDELSAGISGAAQAMEAIGAELEILRAQLKDIDERIRESSERVTKDEKRLNSVKNEKELNAITKEIGGANKAKKQGEQEKSALCARISEKQAVYDGKKADLEKKGEEQKGVATELDAKRGSWKEAIEARLRERDTIKASIRPEVLKKYEMIRSRRGGVGLVLVKNEICQGCFTHIPPQVYIILKKGTEELLSCPHCHRLLYVETQGQLEAV